MQPHEKRVVDERNDLSDKLSKLAAFFVTDTFLGLPEADRILLVTQEEQMTCYLNTLGRRIERF